MAKTVKITTLSENSAIGRCIGEWGLSILVETDGCKVLFDTGRSFTAVLNAQTLGIDLADIDKLVLSHGHYDHTGGLKDVIIRSGGIEIIAHPDVWAPKYKCLPDQEPQYIGMPYPQADLEALGATFTFSKRSVAISEDIITTGEIPQVTGFESTASMLCVQDGDSYHKDDFGDDQALIVKTNDGLVIILGCAHRGVINTLLHAQKITGIDRINAIVGGLHLMSASDEHISRVIDELSKFDIKMIAASHCTGFAACCHLHQSFGDKFVLNNAGTTLTLPAL
jgi:7,8-dihydropterin-6-yl-methyl-4-(beta-D-ribofuranosyl)aminobenzene 5'-phosphate synthase